MNSINDQQIAFALACPLLLEGKQVANPYNFIEQFFSFSSLGEYRQELNRWFRSALNEGTRYKPASNLLFLHNQLLQLTNAGYLIASDQLSYQPTLSDGSELFCDWLIRSGEYNNKHIYNSPYWLEVEYIE